MSVKKETKPVTMKPIAVKDFDADLWNSLQAAGRKKFGYGGGTKALEQAIRAWLRKNKDYTIITDAPAPQENLFSFSPKKEEPQKKLAEDSQTT